MDSCWQLLSSFTEAQVPGMMHQEKAASCTASTYSLLRLQDTCSINGRKTQLRIKMENIEVSANIKLLTKLQPRRVLLWLAYLGPIFLSWWLLRWNNERRESIVAWAVVYSITLKCILVPGEEASFLQLVLSFFCGSSEPCINIPSSNRQHRRT